METQWLNSKLLSYFKDSHHASVPELHPVVMLRFVLIFGSCIYRANCHSEFMLISSCVQFVCIGLIFCVTDCCFLSSPGCPSLHSCTSSAHQAHLFLLHPTLFNVSMGSEDSRDIPLLDALTVLWSDTLLLFMCFQLLIASSSCVFPVCFYLFIIIRGFFLILTSSPDSSFRSSSPSQTAAAASFLQIKPQIVRLPFSPYLTLSCSSF